MYPNTYPHLDGIIGVFGDYKTHEVLDNVLWADIPLDEQQSHDIPHVAVDDFNNLSVYLPEWVLSDNSAAQQIAFHEFAHLYAEYNKGSMLDGCRVEELEAFALYCELVAASYGVLSASVTYMRLKEENASSGLAFEMFCYFGPNIDRALNDISDSDSMNEVAASADG